MKRMQNIRKQRIGENLIYVMVWLVIILVPILSSKMLGEEHVDLEAIFTSWRKIAPYLLLFVINNSLLAPKLLQKRRYMLYVLCDLAVITAIFGAVDLYEQYFLKGLPDAETVIANRKASFTDLALPWNILLGLFMTGTNTMIKMLYQAMRNEQEMEALKHQNLQAEIDYLKYQINPHFFMNTLNNIHALIDIDAEGAKDAVIELSKMMRYVLYDSGQQSISLERDMQFLQNYIQLMRIRYAEELDVRIDYPEREAAGILDSAPAVHRLRGERLQARCVGQPGLVHPYRGDAGREAGVLHDRQQQAPPQRRPRPGYRPEECAQAPRPDLRRPLPSRTDGCGRHLYRSTYDTPIP